MFLNLLFTFAISLVYKNEYNSEFQLQCAGF